MQSQSNHSDNATYHPLEVLQKAGLPAAAITPALARAVEQWCSILPVQQVVQALQQVRHSNCVLDDFRQLALELLQGESALPGNAAGAAQPVGNATVARPLSEADRQALRAQDRLESMTDAEYQEELARRLAQRRRFPLP